MAFLEVVGGAILGAGLAEGFSRLARREERKHVQAERAKERQREAAGELDEALRRAHEELPRLFGEPTAEAYRAAYAAWEEGFFKAARLVRNQDVLERFDAVGWILVTLMSEAERRRVADSWPAIRAIDNARAACAAFMLGEPLGPSSFPSREKAAKLVRYTGEGRDWSLLHEWLHEHPKLGDEESGSS